MNDYITSPTEIIVLENARKAVVVYGIGRLPAAVVQNWQLRHVMNLIIAKKIQYYHKKEESDFSKKISKRKL